MVSIESASLRVNSEPSGAAELRAFRPANNERRAHQRLAGSELSWLNHVRIKYGPDVSLIDLSAGGLQVETTCPLLPASTVVVELLTGDKTWPLPARVLRCHVAAIAPSIRYRGGLAFKRPFGAEDIGAALESALDVNPSHEYARLNLALRRVGETSATNAALLSATGRSALETAFAMIESARGRDSSAPFVKEIGRLLRLLTTSVENGASETAVVPEIISRLRRTVPSQMVRLVDAGDAPMIHPDAVFFRVPAEGMDVPDRLVVEFSQDCRLEVWHLQLLEAAAHLITVGKDLASSKERALLLEPQTAPVDAPQLAERRRGNRLVVHYLDGRLLKGYGDDFLPARGCLDLRIAQDGQPASQITIPFAQLKAVFFVHDFHGNPAHTVASDVEDRTVRGRRITITFVDGEVLRGVTLNYSQNAPGFFVLPLDSTGNNTRIFVPAGAIRHVQFNESSNCTPALQPALVGAR